MERIKGALAVGFLRLLALLPWRAIQGLGSLLGALFYWLPSRARAVVRINLAHCFPELNEAERNALAKRTLRSIGKTFTESACIWLWSPERILRKVRQVEGLEVLQQAVASGKGAVGITSHLGNWEMLAHVYCAHAKPIFLYRPPKLKALDNLLVERRTQMGNRIAASTKQGILSVIKEVRRGGAAGIPADPEPSLGSGLFVPFLGTQALTSKFVHAMIKGRQAEAFFLHALRLPDGSGFKVIIEPVPEAMYSEDEHTAVAAQSEVIGRYVRAYPDQYMWTMKRFKQRPEGEAKWY